MTDESDTRDIGGRLAAAVVQLAHALAKEGYGVQLSVEIQDDADRPAHVAVKLAVAQKF